MVAGSRLHFTLTWLGREDKVNETDTIEQMLAALHRGEIRLGAQKTNGFGHVRLTVKKTCVSDAECRRTGSLAGGRGGRQLLTLPESGVLSSRVKFLCDRPHGWHPGESLCAGKENERKEGYCFRNGQSEGKREKRAPRILRQGRRAGTS